LVAGNVCNTWAYDPEDPATKDTVRAMYAEQLGWAAEEGVDFVISETNDYLGEALIALEVIQDLGLPAMVTMAPTQPHRTRDGYEYADACRILAAEGAQVVGLNCSGPHHVRAMAEALGREVPASRYSPSMELHPMFRREVSAKDAAFLQTWNA
jgi:betaine-homocysteine S-methyltransferase